MTRIVIHAFGTHGDVAPFTGLGQQLRRDLNADVAIAAQQPYAEMISAAGLDFRLLPNSIEQDTRESTYGQELIDGARMNPSKATLASMRDDLAGVGEAMASASRDADLLILGGPIGSLLGYHVAEALGVPSLGALLQPASPTGDFAPPPLTVKSFGRLGNTLMWRAGALGEKVYTPLIDGLRANLDLPARSRQHYQEERSARWPILYGFSRHVVPRPRDWRPGLEVTGYWWPAPESNWQPPAELAQFLDAGPPPIFFGLGSTATAHGDELSAIIARAIRSTGHRGIIQSGWARLHASGEDMLTIDDVPHAWLFPRTAAVVHHGGAGTSAAALRAGVPSIPVVGIMDQPFWAHRLHRIGTATAPLRRVGLTADDLAASMTAATTDATYRQRAQRYSRLVIDEAGATRAVGLIAGHLANQSPQEAPDGR